MWANTQETADLVTFSAEIFNGKFYILCSGRNWTLAWNGLGRL